MYKYLGAPDFSLVVDFLPESRKRNPYGSDVFYCMYATWVNMLAEQHETQKAWIAILREIHLHARLSAHVTVLAALKIVLPPSSH